MNISALPHSSVHVLASDDVSNCGEFCFEESGKLPCCALACLRDVCASYACVAFTHTPSNPNKKRNCDQSAADPRFSGSVRPYRVPQDHLRPHRNGPKEREPVKEVVLPEPVRISAGSVRVQGQARVCRKWCGGKCQLWSSNDPKSIRSTQREALSPAFTQRFRTDPVRLEGGISFSFSMTAGMRWFWAILSSFHR